MTFVMFGGNSSGGVSPLDSTYADYAAAHPISQNAGFVGVALRNLTTDTYVWAVASDTGNNATDKTYTVTEAFIDTLDSAAHYKLEFIDWNQGGWGWTDFDTVHIPGKTEFDDGYLNSIATGDWNVGGTWDGTVPGGIPTSLSIVNVSGGDTVTVPLFSLGAAANELNIAALGAVVVDDPLVVAATVDIEATGTMTVTGNGTLTANAITTEAAGAIAIDASGAVKLSAVKYEGPDGSEPAYFKSVVNDQFAVGDD
jgi:hypothetical protein